MSLRSRLPLVQFTLILECGEPEFTCGDVSRFTLRATIPLECREVRDLVLNVDQPHLITLAAVWIDKTSLLPCPIDACLFGPNVTMRPHFDMDVSPFYLDGIRQPHRIKIDGSYHGRMPAGLVAGETFQLSATIEAYGEAP